MNIIRPNRLLAALVFIICFTQPLASHAFQADANSLIVATTAGQIQGVSRHGGGAEFLGIPYAAAAHRQSPLARTRSRNALDRHPQCHHLRRSLRATRPR